MKKLLALVLALVMTLGLATVGANAALDDFTDGKDVNYTEAMSVMNAVGVFQGSDGKLTPKDNLTRAQAAKIIAYLNLGETAAEALTKDVTAFTDVPAGGWATGYITYCYNTSIVGGRGNNTFDPDANVTALEFAKMLLVTLGYEPQREGLVGSSYALNTAKLAAKAGLFEDNAGVSVNQPATREEAALYAFNALKADTVEYATASTVVEGADGLKVTVGGSNATAVTSAAAYADDIIDETGAGAAADVLQLGEKLYKGDLKLAANAGTDDMNRPANVWTWKTGANATIGKYEKSPDYTAVVTKGGKTYDDIIDDVSKSLKTDYDRDGVGGTYTGGDVVTVNGGSILTGGKTYGPVTAAATVGDYLEIYMRDNAPGQIETVAVTRYSAGKLNADLATRDNSGVKQVRLPGVTGLNGWIDADDIEGYAGLVKDDVVYWYADSATNYHVAKAESFEGQLTTIQTNSTPAKYIIGGTPYILNESTNATGDGAGQVDGLNNTTATYNTDYRFYTDANGQIIYGKKLGETNKNYVMVDQLVYVPAGTAIGSTGRVEARLIHVDGTVEVVKIASINLATSATVTTQTYSGINASATTETTSKTDGTKWLVYKNSTIKLNAACDDEPVRSMLFTYKVNSDDEYELTNADQISGVDSLAQTFGDGTVSGKATDYKTSTGKIGSIGVNDETVFVVVNNPTASSPKYTVYTGKNNAPVLTSANLNDISFVYATEKSVATHVVVYTYGTKSVSGDWVYILGESFGTTQVKDADGTTYTYDLYKALRSGNAEVENLMVKQTLSLMPGLYENLGFDATTGALTAGTYNYTKNASVTPYAGYNLSGTTLSVDKTYGSNVYGTPFDCPSDAIFIYKDSKDNFTVGTAADYSADPNDLIFVAKTNGSDNKVKIAYVLERDVDEDGLFGIATTDATTGALTGLKTSADSPAVTATVTIPASSIIEAKTYTYYKWTLNVSTTGSSTDAIHIVANAGSRVTYSTNTDFVTGVSLTTPTAQVGSNEIVLTPGTGTHNYYVTVTSEDETTSACYYIQVVLP